MEVDEKDLNSEEEMTVLRNLMIQHLVSNNDIVFKSQQIGEPDLTFQEKTLIVEECLKKPVNFLTRFNQYLERNHFDYLKRIYPECQYEIGHYLQENFSRKNETVVKNRRLEALKRLAVGSDYFTEEEMRKRNPLLYEHLVGKYLTPEEKKERSSFANSMPSEEEFKLSSILLEQNDRVRADDLQKEQEDNEEEIEFDTDDEEMEDGYCETSSDSDENDDRVMHLWGESASASNDINVIRNKTSKKCITDEEKKLLFDEFRSHMYSKFIGGKDSDFDYSTVDMNTDYDDLEELDRDEQDKYFTSNDDVDSLLNSQLETNGEFINGQQPEKTVEMAEQNSGQTSDSEDPLDAFMAELNEQQVQQDINSKLKNASL